MLRLHRHRHQSKSGEKADFKLSGFKALQVPKGWEKLSVAVVAAETGKTVGKTSRTAVRNGICQWTETLTESVRVSDHETGEESEDCVFKLIVSMGSARSGILGEASLNMRDYMSTSESVSVSLSLKKCTHGTTLQVTIQCLTPRVISMDEHSKERNSDSEKPNGNHQDHGIKSEEGMGSDNTVAKSFTASSVDDFSLNSNPGELGSRETSFSLSESHQSYDSAEGSIGGEDMSFGDPGSDVQSQVKRADLIGSENCESPGIHRAETFHSKQSSLENPLSTNSTKAFREVSGGTVEELHAEAKMWERNARKLMLDLDVLKEEFSEHSKIQENLTLELSAACAERDVLRREIEELKRTSMEDLRTDDLRFERESNADLTLQLKRSHESNIELVSVLQDLEETVERQKGEIGELVAQHSKFIEENGDENRKLRAQLQEMKELEKDLSVKVKNLEQVLEEKNQQIEKGKILNSQAFLDVENEYKSKLLEKEAEIAKLKAKHSDSLEDTNGRDSNLIREIEELKEKLQELERDCAELTEENLDLLFKLKEAKNEPMEMSTSVDFPARTSFEFQLSEQNLAISFPEETSERNDRIFVQELQSLSIELEAKLVEMDRKLAERKSGMEKLEAILSSKEEEILVMRRCRSELEAKVSDLQKEKAELQEQLEVVLQESEISSKCLNDLQNDLALLTSSVDSHSSVSKLIERKSSELERENVRLSDLVFSMEAQIRDLTGQIESSQSESENSKSRAVYLSGEIDRLRLEMQSTIESLVKECDSLRRSNEVERNEKLGLRDRCSHLETTLEESQNGFADCSRRVADLEQYLSSVLAEFLSKEKSLTLEIEALFEENSRHREKFNEQEIMLSQMYMDKVVESQKLQQEVEHLTKKLSETHDEKERIASNSLEELSRLRAENEKTWSSFNYKETDYEVKLKRLSSELAKSNEALEKLSNSLEKYKSSEAKFKTTISDLELKLTVSEYQRQQRSEECSYLNAELKKLTHLEGELGEIKVEKEKLEALVHAMSEECKDLQAEKVELNEKISALRALVTELEHCNSEKLALEDKVLQMEDELIEIEVLRVRDTELTKELAQMRRENKQFQQKIEQLQAIEDEKQNLKEQHGNRKALKANPRVNPVHETTKNPKNETAKSTNQRRDHRRNQSQRENGGGFGSPEGSPRNTDSLEDQLVKTLEENNKYKAPLNRLSSEGRKGHTNLPRKLTPEDEPVSRAKYERTKSSLEAELRDIRERYLSMSLKYAEVEAEREELVMKLKSTAKTSKRWFS